MSDYRSDEAWATFAGPIDNLAAHRFFHYFAIAIQSGISHVHLLIQSAGGVVGDGLAIYNFLKCLPIQITTYNAGAVESIAVFPYLAGTRRQASAAATFMLHKTSFTAAPRVTADELAVKAQSASLHDSNIELILKTHLTLPPDKWKIHERMDLVISSMEGIEYGLVHEVADFAPSKGSQLFNI